MRHWNVQLENTATIGSVYRALVEQQLILWGLSGMSHAIVQQENINSLRQKKVITVIPFVTIGLGLCCDQLLYVFSVNFHVFA